MIPTVCARCGNPVTSNSEFCEYCGAPLNPIVGAEPVDTYDPHLEPLPDDADIGIWSPERVLLVAVLAFAASLAFVALLLIGLLGLPR